MGIKETRATVKQVTEKLEGQDYKCALTGWELQPDSFALDHIVPMSQGGDDSIENLDCVHAIANQAKGTMGKQEFIAMCIAVARHNGCENQPPYALSLGK